MSEIQLNTCPICGCWSRFQYGGAMDSGKQIVKVRCDIGCVEQVIFYCEESDAAKAWNFRTPTPEFRDLLEALRLCYDHCRLYYPEVEHNNVGEVVRDAIAKAEGKS
jgi:hypothetical protein